MARKKKHEYREPEDYKWEYSDEEKDEFNNEPPMLSRSDSRRTRKKSFFRYPFLNMLMIF
ncbi:Uncharacterised protein [Listeria grayi]|nr:Uncharacterised protein [Listeria grayi]